MRLLDQPMTLLLPGRGRPASVRQQQSTGMQGCTPHAWPLDHELAGVRR